MKTIALFGATGQTGEKFLPLILNMGFSVKALVRNPDKLTLTSSALTVIKGDVLNKNDVYSVVEKTDIVLSLFGHVKGSPNMLQTRGTENIVEAMNHFNISRIISLSGGGLPYPEKDRPTFMDRLIRTIMKIVVPKILNDAIAHHRVLEQSGLDWVIVRAPRLTNAPKKNSYRVGWVGVNASTQISRLDLADFLVEVVTSGSFTKQMPFVSWCV